MSNEEVENIYPFKKVENSLTKEQFLNIDEVFKDNLEIANIFNANKELFQKYLDSIFPDSKVKEIVWHGTNSKFEEEKFDKSRIGTSTQNITSKFGFYFVPDKKVAGIFTKGSKIEADKGIIRPENSKIYPVLLLIKNPEIIEGKIFREYAERNEMPPLRLNGDSIIINAQTSDANVEFCVKNYVVFEPEQIHILGSEQDILQAKEWLKNK